MRIFGAIIFILVFKNSLACECELLKIETASELYSNIFVGEVLTFNNEVRIQPLKIWKGDLPTDSLLTFSMKALAECDVYALYPGSGIFVFFTGSVKNEFCNTAKRYYNFEHVQFLENKFKDEARIATNTIELIKKVEYERQYLVHTASGPIDINGKNVVFIEQQRLIGRLKKFVVKDWEDIKRYSGFYNTQIFLVETNYSSLHCHYDYVFFAVTAHQQYKLTDGIRHKTKTK